MVLEKILIANESVEISVRTAAWSNRKNSGEDIVGIHERGKDGLPTSIRKVVHSSDQDSPVHIYSQLDTAIWSKKFRC